MHPVEHCWYFAAAFPLLFFPSSSFFLLYIGYGLMLSPAASHSGWEDAMQSDSHHYMHHRFFEVNYASYDAAAMDVMFGTFMGSFADEPGCEKESEPVKPRKDEKATLAAPPSLDFCVFLVGCIAAYIPWLRAVAAGSGRASREGIFASALAGFAPLVLAAALHWGKKVGAASRGWAQDGLLWVIGVATSPLPVAYMCWLCL